MRILVVGAGAVGGWFGGRLAAAGFDVWFLARGAQAEALRRRGLRLHGPEGETHIPEPQLVGETMPEGGFDILLVAVKMYDLEAVVPGLAALAAPRAAVIPLQNGVEAPTLLARRLDPAMVCGGLAKIGAVLERPGVVTRVGSMAELLFGERDGRPSPRLEAFAAACREAGFTAACVADIEVRMWEKFVFLAPFAAATARRRAPIGAVRADPAAWRDLLAMTEEATAVGRAQGVGLPPDLPARTAAFLRGLPAAMRSSLLHDLEAGRRLELDWLTGAVLRLGARSGVPTPVTADYHRALAPFAAGGAPGAGA